MTKKCSKKILNTKITTYFINFLQKLCFFDESAKCIDEKLNKRKWIKNDKMIK